MSSPDKTPANSDLPRPTSVSSSGPPQSPTGSVGSGGSGTSSKRPKFAPTGSRSRLDRQTSRDSAADRKRGSIRRMSSFDLNHSNFLGSVPDIKRLESIDQDKVPWWTSQRFLLAIICFWGFGLLYAQRVNLSIAIVSMVAHGVDDSAHKASHYNSTTPGTQVYSGNGSGVNVTVVYGGGTTTAAAAAPAPGVGGGPVCRELEKKVEEGEFHWSKELQGLLLGGFFWGYLLLQVAGGMVSERFGAKRVVALGMFPVAILNILSPVCARANPYLFLVVRILVGVGEGVMYPAVQALWSSWAPPNERSRLIGFSYAGGQFGNAIIFPVGGFLSASGVDGGWPLVFYVIGTCGFIWCIVWVLFASDSPQQNTRISDIEKKYIQYSIGDRAKFSKKRSTPWKSIFTSRGVWAIIVTHTCGNYGVYMLLTQIPTYMKEVLNFDIKSNGVFSMLPYLAFWLFITLSGMLADLLISRGTLSVAWTRKLMATLGLVGPACFLIGTGFMQCHQQTEAVVLLTIAVGLCGFQFSAYFVNHGDIAPAFAGTLFGISNTVATVPGMVAPYVVSALTPNRSQQEWQNAFYVAAAVYFVGAAAYLLLARGEVEPWATAEVDDSKGNGREGAGFALTEIHEPVPEVEEEDDDEEEEEKVAEKMLREANGGTGVDTNVV